MTIRIHISRDGKGRWHAYRQVEWWEPEPGHFEGIWRYGREMPHQRRFRHESIPADPASLRAAMIPADLIFVGAMVPRRGGGEAAERLASWGIGIRRDQAPAALDELPAFIDRVIAIMEGRDA